MKVCSRLLLLLWLLAAAAAILMTVHSRSESHSSSYAPGFIPVQTHVENIYSFAAAENFIRMGVSSLVTGKCGTSATDVREFLGRIKTPPLAVNLATLIAHGSVRHKVDS